MRATADSPWPAPHCWPRPRPCARPAAQARRVERPPRPRRRSTGSPARRPPASTRREPSSPPALACLDVAVEQWTASQGTQPLAVLPDTAIAAIRE
ncbi:hypothetical protein ACRAWF_05235 [Streptomyces sp. L7]